MKNILKTLLLIFAFTIICSISVYASSIDVDGVTYFEAENTSYIQNPMIVEDDATASNGKFVHTVPGTSSSGVTRATVHMKYNITVPEDDGYILWVRARVNDGTSCSFSADFDDAVFKEPFVCTDAFENQGEWVWCFVDKFYLYEGDHELNIRYRVRDLEFDQFCITSDFNFLPEGAKPGITPPDKIYERDAQGNIKNLYYNLPSYLPPDEHPRLMFRKQDIERIKANLTHPQNIAEYEALLKLAEFKTDGKQTQIKYGDAHNVNTKIGLAAESNAFLYQLTGDKTYGYKAIEIAKNFIESTMIDRSNASSTGRSGMNAVWITALCYDWCYDLLTEEDKDHLVFYMLLQSSYSEPGYPCIGYDVSTNHSEINGHILEFQLLVGQFGAAVAIYDEYPDVYNVAAGRILQYIVPAVNIFNRSGTFTEGNAYGMYRYSYEVINNYMFKAMGHDNVYTDIGFSTMGNIYNRQPDGEQLQWGDDGNYYKTGYVEMRWETFFYLGNMYKNPWYKNEFLRTRKGTQKSISDIASTTSPAMWLIVNDVDVEANRSFRSYPLTLYTGPESGMMFARTSWDEGFDANTVACLLNLKTRYIHGHEHMDAGHFSLYYKGLLALDSGIYQGVNFTDSKGNYITDVGYGNLHHLAYARQTIAHNSLLIDDPEERQTPTEEKKFSTTDGGQKFSVYNWVAKTPEELWSEDTIIGETLSYNWGPDPMEPQYSYMKGDITNAYTSKVENVERSFMFFNFNDETYPAALLIFDNVRSASPAFKKTWLLHSEEEPVINGNTTTVARETTDYHGRLVNTTLMPTNGFKINKIGGPGHEFEVDGVNYEMSVKASTAEVGNWRVEISPTKAEKQSYFLNVIQVSENEDKIVPLEAKLVEDTDTYAAAEINNHIAYFRKDGTSTTKALTINPGKAENERFIVVTGLAAGMWSVYDENGLLVATDYAYDGRDSISFTAKGAKFDLKHKYVPNLVAPDYSVYALREDVEKSIDVQIDGYYETFENEWYYYDGNLFAPIAETMDKFDIKDYSADFSNVTINKDSKAYHLVYGKNNVTRFNGVLYAPVKLLEKITGCATDYDPIGMIVRVSYGMRDRDLENIHRYNDSDIINIVYAYTEGETTANALNSIDGDTTSYSCTIGDGGNFIAMLETEPTISKIALYWVNGTARKEIFDMYVSKDGKEWKQVFTGMSDGKTNGFEYMPVDDNDTYRYVKLECHGNTQNSYNSLAEIIVYK